MAAPPQIRETRQHDPVCIPEFWGLRPIIGKHRFDDNLIFIGLRMSEPVFQKTALGQPPYQLINFLLDGVAIGGKRVQRQTRAQIPRANHGSSAELSERDGIAIGAGGDTSVRLRFQREMAVQPG